MTKELRFALTLGVCALVSGQFFAATGFSNLAFTDLSRLFHSNLILVLIGTILCDAFVLHVLTRPSRAELAITLGMGSILSVLLGTWTYSRGVPSTLNVRMFNAIASGFGIASMLVLSWRMVYSTGRDRDLARHIALFTLFVALMVLSAGAYLSLGSGLQPGTFDLPTYHVDASLGFNPSVIIALYGVIAPEFKTVITAAYSAIAFSFPVLYALQLASPQRPPVNYIKAWPTVILLVYFVYFLYPIAGPLYMFGAKVFPAYVPDLNILRNEITVVPPAPRNGMPSMHFGWALLFWMNAGLLANARVARIARAVGAVFLALTALATLMLGEHYLVDLIVAVPFIVAVQALCTDVLPWSHAARRNATAIGFGITAAWILGLRVSPGLFINIPGFTWIATLATLLASILLYRALARHSRAACEGLPPLPVRDETITAGTHEEMESKRDVRYAGIMFVLSGFAGIMYEVLFSKALALTFGSTSSATYTVLATYMGGMAIGAWLGGRVAAGSQRPLALYAFCEFGIALYCAATPIIFKAIQSIYVGLATGMPPDAAMLTVFRLSLGMGALIVPTILMGMSLPIMARFFEGRSRSLGGSVAVLYGANTFGAAFGALAAGYFVLPMLGVHRTTLAAAMINLIAALLAIELHKRVLARTPESVDVEPTPLPVQRSSHAAPGSDARWLGNLALIILCVGGALTLAIEIKYFHLLAVVAGNSTYAFSLMLFTFLLGLGAGAEISRRLLRHDLSLKLLLGWLEFGLAAVILAGIFLWSRMPDYFARFAEYPMARDFGAREVIRGLACWLAMFPPAMFIGAIYPVAMECIGRARAENPIRALGWAAALNTLGNIVGVLVGAFVLLPYIGAFRSVQLLALVCIVLGGIALWRTPSRSSVYKWAPACIAGILFAIQPGSFDYNKITTGANVYFYPQTFGKVIDHSESVDGGLTSVSLMERPNHPPVRTLLTNAKFQGNDSNAGEMQAQIGFAFSPLLHTSHRDKALVIGYGTGVSARTLHAAGFAQLDVVDLSADVVRMANKYFSSVNDRVTEKPGVKTYITDGRNFLMLNDQRYDLIGLEITSIWFAGAASLYNQEFYQLVKQRLQPHGVLQQWVQLHHMANTDILRIIGSVRAEFPYVWLYLIGNQGIIIASNDAGALPSREHALQLKQTPALQPLLEVFHDDPANLLQARLLDPAGTDRLLGGFGVPSSVWVSTDDNLFLEYSTPKGNALNGNVSFESNIKFIEARSAVVPNAPKGDLAALGSKTP